MKYQTVKKKGKKKKKGRTISRKVPREKLRQSGKAKNRGFQGCAPRHRLKSDE